MVFSYASLYCILNTFRLWFCRLKRSELCKIFCKLLIFEIWNWRNILQNPNFGEVEGSALQGRFEFCKVFHRLQILEISYLSNVHQLTSAAALVASPHNDKEMTSDPSLLFHLTREPIKSENYIWALELRQCDVLRSTQKRTWYSIVSPNMLRPCSAAGYACIV